MYQAPEGSSVVEVLADPLLLHPDGDRLAARVDAPGLRAEAGEVVVGVAPEAPRDAAPRRRGIDGRGGRVVARGDGDDEVIGVVALRGGERGDAHGAREEIDLGAGDGGARDDAPGLGGVVGD